MLDVLILIESISRNFALFSGALFAGAATYVSLVERPAIAEGGVNLANSYLMFSQPRPLVFQSSFAGIGGLSGILAGLTAAHAWWLTGGLILLSAALFNIFIIAPEARKLVRDGEGTDKEVLPRLLSLTRHYAIQSIAGLAALFIFVMGS